MDATGSQAEPLGRHGARRTVAPPRPEWEDLAVREAESWARLHAEVSAGRETMAHPAQGSLAAWHRELDRVGLAGPAAEVRALAARLFHDQLATWRAGSGSPGAGDRAADWCAALTELEAARREAEELGLEGDWKEYAEWRDALRGGLVAACAATSPSAWTRRAWADRLVDAADEVLASVEDLRPADAERVLADVKERLDWHLREIEQEPGDERQRLRRRRARLAAEGQERRLQGRLEGLFGRRALAWWERGVLLAITLALSVVLVPAFLDLGVREQYALLWFDTAVCAYLLTDFGLKATLTGWRWSWLRRHLVIDLLPALPFGLLVLVLEGAGAVQGARGLVVLRLLRLPRVAGYLRALLPLIRIARAVGFLLRGCDRLVRLYGRILDRDVILYPTPGERQRARERDGMREEWARRAELDRLWTRALAGADERERDAVAASRLVVLRTLAPVPDPERGVERGPRSDLCLDDLCVRLASIPAEEIEGELGSSFVSRLGRGLRGIARTPLRWLPGLAGLVPRGEQSLDDPELAARFTRAIGARLGAVVAALHWLGDLYGTLTPSDLVGRLGATLVRRTARPAMRLFALALAYGALAGSAQLFGMEVGQWAARIGGLIGTTLLVLGSACFLLLGLGFWLQRVASDASAFYQQVAAAQFVHLTEGVKARRIARDADLLDERVFALERALHGEADPRHDADQTDRDVFLEGLRSWLLEGVPVERSSTRFDPVARCVLLYRDVLDGALLGESDTRATSQLLGNLALERVRLRAGRVDDGESRTLARLDLLRKRGLGGGPYLWFNLIARAMTQQVARLIVDYDDHAIPLEELEHASEDDRGRFEAWLASRSAHPEDPTSAVPARRRGQLTTAFTALHFLDDSAERDAAIEGRFGPRVVQLLRRDRRALFRRVFGTYPLHLLPTEERVLNLRAIYRGWFEGGRVLLLPPRLVLRGALQLGRGFRWLAEAVRRIRDPRLAYAGDERAESDFATAFRKIDRMRGPLARACLRQLAWFDPEYLGVSLPGRGATTAGTWREDLDRLGAPVELCEEVERERESARRDVRRLKVLLQGGLAERITPRVGPAFRPGPEHVRAVVVALRADLDGVRSTLFAREVLEETFTAVSGRPPLPPVRRLQFGTRRDFARYWRSRGGGERDARLRCWRAVARDLDGAGRALRAWSIHGDGARAVGEDLLVEVLRHPANLTETVVTARAVLALALIDLANYRGHVYRLGEFAASGDAAPAEL